MTTPIIIAAIVIMRTKFFLMEKFVPFEEIRNKVVTIIPRKIISEKIVSHADGV